MQKVAWWGKLVFVLVNVAIASYFANPFAGVGQFFGWLISLFVSVLVTGIVVAGALMLVALLTRGAAFLAQPLVEQAGQDAAGRPLGGGNPDPAAGRLTENQREALTCADAGRVLYPAAQQDAMVGDALFDKRTLESLKRRGLLAGDEATGYQITPAGRVSLGDHP